MLNSYLQIADVFSLTFGIANLILFLTTFHKIKKEKFDLFKKEWRRQVFFPINLLLCLTGAAVFTLYVSKYSFILSVFGVQKPLTQYIFSKTSVNFMLFIWLVLVAFSLNLICLTKFDKGIKPLANQGELILVTSLLTVVLAIMMQMMLRQLFQFGYSSLLFH